MSCRFQMYFAQVDPGEGEGKSPYFTGSHSRDPQGYHETYAYLVQPNDGDDVPNEIAKEQYETLWVDQDEDGNALNHCTVNLGIFASNSNTNRMHFKHADGDDIMQEDADGNEESTRTTVVSFTAFDSPSAWKTVQVPRNGYVLIKQMA